MEIKTTVELLVGDDVDDGHNLKESFYYDINCTYTELFDFFMLGTKKCGVSLLKHCSEFEDNILPITEVNKLINHGILVVSYANCYDTDEDGSIVFNDPLEYVAMWLRIAKYGCPELTYKQTENRPPILNIGGYGLFYL